MGSLGSQGKRGHSPLNLWAARQPHPIRPGQPQAAQLLNLVWEEDDESGVYLWTSFMTGGRRGELVGLRESRFDFDLQEVRLPPTTSAKGASGSRRPPRMARAASCPWTR